MALSWRALRVTGGARWAIYDEAFPADLADALRPFPAEVSDAFGQEAALAAKQRDWGRESRRPLIQACASMAVPLGNGDVRNPGLAETAGR